MSTGTLVVDIEADAAPAPPPVHLLASASELCDRLQRKGYSQLQLGGLHRLGATLVDGKPGNEFTFPVDPDAQFLLEFAATLEKLVAERGTRLLRTYLADGIFEVSAFVTPDRVLLRAGIFRDVPFEPPYPGAVELPARTFLEIWRSIAHALVAAAV
jgi:hypothetical protein